MSPAFRGSGSSLHILLVVWEAKRNWSEWSFKLCTQIEPQPWKMYFGTSFFLFLFQFSREAEETVSTALSQRLSQRLSQVPESSPRPPPSFCLLISLSPLTLTPLSSQQSRHFSFYETEVCVRCADICLSDWAFAVWYKKWGKICNGFRMETVAVFSFPLELCKT